MVRRIALGLAVGAMLLPAAWSSADEGVMFAHHFEAGAIQRYRIRVNMDADMHGTEMSQLADMEVTVKCLADTAGKWSMEMKFDKVEMSRSMMGNMESDPRGDQLVGHAVDFTVDAEGKVSDVKSAGYFEAWDGLRSLLEPVVEDTYVYLPGKTEPVGGQWTQQLKEKQPTGVEVTTNATYTFKETKKEKGRDCASVEGVVENQLGGQVSGPMGSMSVSGKGTGKFDFLFDPAAGLVVKYKGKYDMEMNMVPSSASGDAVQTTVGYDLERELL